MTLKKRDLLFILVIIMLIIAVNIVVIFALKKDADYIELSVDGEIVDTYSLLEDRTVKVFEKDKINNFEIKGGTVRMTEADCPDGTCIRQGTISKHNETIVCLPHRVVIRAVSTGDTKDSLDTLVK